MEKSPILNKENIMPSFGSIGFTTKEIKIERNPSGKRAARQAQHQKDKARWAKRQGKQNESLRDAFKNKLKLRTPHYAQMSTTSQKSGSPKGKGSPEALNY
jgi:hypothetical protein